MYLPCVSQQVHTKGAEINLRVLWLVSVGCALGAFPATEGSDAVRAAMNLQFFVFPRCQMHHYICNT